MKTGIEITKKEFIIQNNVVVCLITANTYYPYEILTLIDVLFKETALTCIKVRGVAKCSKEDTFDIEYGKKLAEARAMKEVFKEFNKYFKKLENYTGLFVKFAVERVLATNLAIQSEKAHINWLKK